MNSDRNEGEIWIKNYILKLYVQDKLSKDLGEFLNLIHERSELQRNIFS